MAKPMQRYGTVRNGTVRHQDSPENPPVPDTRTPVDKGVTLTISTNVWGRLATVADERGVTVQELIVTALRPIITPDTLETRVASYARAGLTDTQICELTGRDRAYVARTRRAAGIRANKKARQSTVGESA
jgi:hypothetical protein